MGGRWSALRDEVGLGGDTSPEAGRVLARGKMHTPAEGRFPLAEIRQDSAKSRFEKQTNKNRNKKLKDFKFVARRRKSRSPAVI